MAENGDKNGRRARQCLGITVGSLWLAACAQTAVGRLADSGADLVKVYENLSREAYFAILDEGRRRGIPVDGQPRNRIYEETLRLVRRDGR